MKTMKTAAILLSLQEFLNACREQDLRMVICYADASGNPRMIWREDGAWLGSLDIAVNKAWTATAFSGPTSDGAMTTEALADMTQPGEPLYGLQNTNNNRVVIFGGGIPVYIDGRLHGSVGVSGSTVENDIAMAKIAVQSYLKASVGV